jgi:hypothetical protein
MWRCLLKVKRIAVMALASEILIEAGRNRDSSAVYQESLSSKLENK